MRHELSTDSVIDAPIERVWTILTDFAGYPAWNPFVLRVEGALELGRQLRVTMRGPSARVMTIRPRVVLLEQGREFAWSATLPIPGAFAGEHHFALATLGGGRTQFRHFERFRGVLVPLLKKMLETQVRDQFRAMNEALKRRARDA